MAKWGRNRENIRPKCVPFSGEIQLAPTVHTPRSFVETAFFICAIVGGTLIVCQFALSLLGIGGDNDVADHSGHDVAGGDHDGTHESGHGNSSTHFLGMLTFRTLSAAVAFFGLAGLAAMHSEVKPAPTIGLAVLAGAGALYITSQILRMVSKLNVDGTVRVNQAIGARGTVYLSIPGGRGGTDKVHVTMLGRSVEYNAVTHHTDTLAAGTPIIVGGVVSGDTVEVTPLSTAERTSNVG